MGRFRALKFSLTFIWKAVIWCTDLENNYRTEHITFVDVLCLFYFIISFKKLNACNYFLTHVCEAHRDKDS